MESQIPTNEIDEELYTYFKRLMHNDLDNLINDARFYISPDAEETFRIDAIKKIIKGMQKDKIKTGLELFEKSQAIQKLSTGIQMLDFKLDGGLSRNKIYEIQGISGIGKSSQLDKIVSGVLSQVADNSKVKI